MTELKDRAYIPPSCSPPEEIERYKRQLVLKEIGGEGQQKLKAARVLVIGAGGLGSPLILYLAAAGIGQIGIIDSDRVSLDNLQRQIVHDTKSVGRSKTKSAAQTIERLNPQVETRLYTTRLVAENALGIVGGYDIVADGSDNFATRYLVNDACYFAKVPLVFAAVGPFDGHLTTFRAFETRRCGQSAPVLSLPVPRAAAGRDGRTVLRGRHSRRGRRRDRLPRRGRSGQGAARPRREPGRPAAAL